ncbi:MAG: alpha-glucuronidase family glycosyl hydrolase [Terracidiphilus sp.]
MRSRFRLAAVLAVICGPCAAAAQTSEQAWLDHLGWHGDPEVPLRARALGQTPLLKTAAGELNRGLWTLYAASSRAPGNIESEAVVGTAQQLRAAFPAVQVPSDLGPDAYWIAATDLPSRGSLLIAGGDERGALYGAFALLRLLAQEPRLPDTAVRSTPALAIRWVDEWDNADGSIERGYAGRSLFFEGGKVRDDLGPVAEYARLLASVGIDGCNLNNVNNATAFLTPEMLAGVARVARAMRPWGVRIALSVDLASPQKLGGLPTYDPLDPAVKAWWEAKVDEIYRLIPDFAGFTVKADSEGQPGPASFGRTPADAANTLASALAPHGGLVLYRAFVYNHHLDWRDPKADRARAAYDIFQPLDGKFAANVIVQTKEGPIDFQAREPVSPLFAGLRQTSQAMEVQITQEYTGQQRHLVYLAPMWKQVLDTDLRADRPSTPVREILAGKSFHRPQGGMVGVAGVGRDAWLGSPLALANLYAFGRLAWDPTLQPAAIAEEWTRQTISTDPEVVATVVKMLMQSWPAYEAYTGPLGMQTLTDITGSHYGPNIESSENNGWGQWHRADKDGVGMDRSVATGTGYAGQYPPEVARIYEDAKITPDELLLFFHHVPYTWRLHSGKTVIQHIYDSHYEGAEQAEELRRQWATLEGRIDQPLYEQMRDRLRYQAGHAIVWRDAIVQYFLKLSGIPDDKGRAGHHPNRLEAEDAKLTGYKIIDVQPWEDASGGKAVSCEAPQILNRKGTTKPFCTAEWTWTGKDGMYDIAVQYFDLHPGAAKFFWAHNGKLEIGPRGQIWTADAELPSALPHGDNSTRHLVREVWLTTGQTIGIEAEPNGNDRAVLDYIEVIPAKRDPELVPDLPCPQGRPIEEGDPPDAVNETVGPELAGWAGETNVGTPIEGMLVEVFHPGDKTPIATTRTNEEGGFRFSGLAPGRYRVKASGVVEYGDEEIVRLDPNAKAQLCLVVE